MEIEIIDYDFSICKVEDTADVDLEKEFCFVSRTDDELSVVCRTECAPERAAAREDGWKAFRVAGVLDFSLIGILAGISAVLAANQIGIFVVSTYNTDYIFTKKSEFEKAVGILSQSGYRCVKK